MLQPFITDRIRLEALALGLLVLLAGSIGHAQQKPGSDVPVISPVAPSFGLSFSGSGRTGGDLMANELAEFRGTANMGWHAGVMLRDKLQVGLHFSIGLGGMNNSDIAEFYGFPQMDAFHYWIGIEGRWHLWRSTWFPLRPYIVGRLGADRVVTERNEPTGDVVCDRYGCEDETERIFAVGYWGLSRALGLGVAYRLRIRGATAVELFAETFHQRDIYTRVTHTELPNYNLDEPLDTRSVYTLVGFRVTGF